MTPEELFMSGRQSHQQIMDRLGFGPGRDVSPPIWRWRVLNGWKVPAALSTHFEFPSARAAERPSIGSPSRFRGVTAGGKKGWRARIEHAGKTHHLGYFHNEELAACAYDCAAIQFKGVDAKLNFTKPKSK